MKSVRLWWLLACVVLIDWVPLDAQNLIPVRTEVAGFPEWQDVNVSGTGYLQLLVAGASTTSPELNLTAYSSAKLDYKSRTYGGTNAEENTYTVSVSTDNGNTWNTIATRIPAGASLAAEPSIDLTAYSAAQVKVRFSVAGTNAAIGVGIDDISITGQGALVYTLSLKKDGSDYVADGFPTQLSSGSQVTLPVLTDCGDWNFAGWDADPAVTSTPTWSGGATYTTTAANVVLYAIFQQYDRSGETWTEAGGLTDLMPGTYVITNGDYYLPATEVTNGPALKTMSDAGVTVSSGKLTGTVKEEMRWNFTGTSSAMTIKSAAFYLFNKDLSDGVNVGSTQVNWAFEENLTGFSMKDTGFSRYCAVNPDALEWRSYTTRNSSYYKVNTGILELYKLSGSSQLKFTSTPGCTVETITEPTAHVSNLSAALASPAFSSVTLHWTDAPDATGFLIKCGSNGVADPVDGVAETNGTLVKNVAAGIQQVTFTGLEASTIYTFAVYAYNGSGTSINYKTDGIVPTIQLTTSGVQWIETFDTGSKISYAAADVSLATGSWNLTEAVLGSTTEDKKNGTKSARLRTSGIVSMNFDKTNGAGVIKVLHANYGSLTGGTWKLQLSYNSGIDWVDTGTAVSCESQLQAAYFSINRSELLRCRVVQTGGDRINIDDISISDFSAPPATTSWKGSLSDEWLEYENWSNGIPGASTAVGIESHPNSPEINTEVVLSSLVLDPAARLSITAGGGLSVTGDVTLKSSSSGTATLVNKGTITVAGKSRVEQYLEASGSSTGWWYLSSPVTGAESGTILNAFNGNKLGYYDEPTAAYPQLIPTNIPLVPGKGYLAYIAATGVYNFEGQLNDGPIGPISLTRTGTAGAKRGFNLIGNPYPSFIDWNAVSGYGTGQARTDIRPTIWVRTRTSGGKMVFDTFDGEVGTSLGIRGKVNRYIAPFQAFWVKVATDGSSPSFTFTNEMRSHQDQGIASNRLRMYEDQMESTNQLRTPTNQPLVRLELLSENQDRDQTLITSKAEAEDGYDFYDSEKMPVEQAEIFSIVEQQELVINKLKSMDSGKKVGLGIRLKQPGTYSIKATELTIADTLKVVLKDKITGTETNLQEGINYTFMSDLVEDLQRFIIEFRTRETISSVKNSYTEQPSIYRDLNQFIVVEWDMIESGEELQLFGTDGRLLHQQPATGTSTRLNLKVPPGIYILRIPSKTKNFKILQ